VTVETEPVSARSARALRQHQKGATSLDFNEARDDGVAVALARPLASHLHLAPKPDNHASILSLNFFTGRMLFLMPNQQCQSTEGQSTRT